MFDTEYIKDTLIGQWEDLVPEERDQFLSLAGKIITTENNRTDGYKALRRFSGILRSGNETLAGQRAAIIQDNVDAVNLMLDGSREEDLFEVEVPELLGHERIFSIAGDLDDLDGIGDCPTTAADVDESTLMMGEVYLNLRKITNELAPGVHLIKDDRTEDDLEYNKIYSDCVNEYVKDLIWSVSDQLPLLTGEQVYLLLEKVQVNLDLPALKPDEGKLIDYQKLKAEFLDNFAEFKQYLQDRADEFS